MSDKPVVEWIRRKYSDLSDSLAERGRRTWAAVEARSLGWGGVTVVAEATGIAESTIRRGLEELETRNTLPEGYQRRSGGGRKKAEESDLRLVDTLNKLVEPSTLGDPQSPLRWTTKSTRTLAIELTKHGHRIGPQPFASSFAIWATACKRTARRGRGKIIPTVMHNSVSLAAV